MNTFCKLFLLLQILGFCSCRKVIDIKLRDTDIKYVVEGEITNEPGFCRVLISRSIPFNNENQFPVVTGANVTIKDNGTVVQLNEVAPGIYETNAINGTPGHLYSLEVKIEDQVFAALSKMPQPVMMDSLYVSRGPMGQFKFATIQFTDPLGEGNGYRFIQYVNGIREPTIYWSNDRFTDGQFIERQLDVPTNSKDDPRNIETGDVVTVEMLCIDENVFKYWYSLRADGGDGSANAAAPSNPITNISGGALGYFSAHTVHRKTVTAP